MGEKKSSFHMGNEFNGKGKKVYLRATQHNTYAPLSQENVRVTPNFAQYTQQAVGAMPVVNSGDKGVGTVMKALGGVPCVSQVIVKKDDKTGKYKAELSVRKNQLTTGSYLYSNKKKSEKKKEKIKLIMDTVSNCIKNS